MSIRDKVLEVARQQLGVSEPSGDDKYIRWYNSEARTSFGMNVSWCFIFASWVLRMSGTGEETCPVFASCGAGIQWAKENKCWKPARSGYTPLPADLVIFDWKADGKQDHIGIVVEADNNVLYTIEGNTSNRVAERIYDLTDKEIMGYIAIPYVDDKDAENLTEQKPETTPVDIMRIAKAQAFLNKQYKCNLAVDNIWGPKSRKGLVKAVQKALNEAYRSWLAVDGVWGPMTQKAWRNVSKGNSGALVYLLQIALIAHGYEIDMDGIFGKQTLKAVKEFQSKNALTVDGIVGQLTMSKLVK